MFPDYNTGFIGDAVEPRCYRQVDTYMPINDGSVPAKVSQDHRAHTVPGKSGSFVKPGK